MEMVWSLVWFVDTLPNDCLSHNDQILQNPKYSPSVSSWETHADLHNTSQDDSEEGREGVLQFLPIVTALEKQRPTTIPLSKDRTR